MNVMDMNWDEIPKAISDGFLTVGVFGLGWMGLPTVCLFVEAGARVIGADVDSEVIKWIKTGRSHVNEVGVQPILAKHLGDRLTVTTNIRQATSQSDVLLVVVPTMINKIRKPDYTAIERVCRDIGLALKRGCLVVIESTVGVGVTKKVAGEVLEANSGLTMGTDFGLAYSPIRAMAGRAMKDLQTYPKIVGGIDSRSLEVAASVLSTIAKAGVIKVRDLRTAEAVKLFENVYRDVNIALATELALFCEKMNLDFMDVREAAVTQPYCHLHVPRVGVGGHCLPYNPYFLISEAESIGEPLRLIKYARNVNDKMPAHIVDLVINGLKRCHKRLKRSKIAVLGVSYRDNIKEAKNSPTLEIIEMLMRRGARVKVYDPFFSIGEIQDMGFSGAESVKGVVEGADCILIAVGHKQFKQLKISRLARLVTKPACIIDGWQIFNIDEVHANNLIYSGVGVGEAFSS